MSAFTKFLTDTPPGRQGASARRVFLGVFGKHPAWDDHIEDIGLDTQSLIQAKQLLYVQGIGGQIDAGSWERLAPEQKLPRFQHVFAWLRPSQFLVGRLWASTDGKGRARYPMVACVHGIGVPLSWATREALPQLESLQRACQTTEREDKVRAIVAEATEKLCRSTEQLPPSITPEDNGLRDRQRLLDRAEWSPSQDTLLRVLHQVKQQMTAYFNGQPQGGADTLSAKPQQIRVPMGADAPGEAIQLWAQFFYLLLSQETAMLLTVPLEGGAWVDATAGEPGTNEFFCLRAGTKMIPVTSTIPFHLESDLGGAAEKIVSAMRLGEDPWWRPACLAPGGGLTSRLSTLWRRTRERL